MLAGYLPFDDDPANPEGDNINLLYKYIVNTPLTFPEYVTPHARDLLRRILVPNPRKRADLFEVARHSWLSEYAHVVEFITSSTTSPKDIQNTTVPPEDEDIPTLARSASVRESSRKTTASPTYGGLVSKQGTVDSDAEAAAYAKQQRDNKRRTVQVEYVAPSTTTQRGEPSSSQASTSRAGAASSGTRTAADIGPVGTLSSPKEKPLSPQSISTGTDPYGKTPVTSRKPPNTYQNANSAAAPAPTIRTGREGPSTSAAFGSSTNRPPTGGSLQSAGSKGPVAGTKTSYGQPVPPEVADTNAQGRIQQPQRAGNNYGIPTPASQPQTQEYGQSSTSQSSKLARLSGFPSETTGAAGSGSAQGADVKGHKRSSTVGDIGGKLFGRSGSLFGGRSRKRAEQQAGEKIKKYPPVSMNNAFAGGDDGRQSMDSKRSRRSFSIGLGKKTSGSLTSSQKSHEKHTRRFSFIPASFSLKAIGIGKEEPNPQLDSQQDLPIQEPPAAGDQHGAYGGEQDVGGDQHVEASTLDGMYAQLHEPRMSGDLYGRYQQYDSNGYGHPSASHGYIPGTGLGGGSDQSVDKMRRPAGSAPQLPPLSHLGQQEERSYDTQRVAGGTKTGRGVLQKNKRFVDAWETDAYARGHDHSGSSGPARKVMDFFRRRGKARAGELN
ncbi:hypothetical protein VTH82DRAFT_3877 [Thermothelomyces myriococcoides]